ncbi:unnamed protein product [Urochloa humidicola]
MTLKCDVFSFVVVLLEVISGQGNCAEPSLLSHTWKLWEEHRIMDPPRSGSAAASLRRRRPPVRAAEVHPDRSPLRAAITRQQACACHVRSSRHADQQDLAAGPAKQARPVLECDVERRGHLPPVKLPAEALSHTGLS